MQNKKTDRKTKIEMIEERKKINGFNQYILKRYGNRGATILKLSEGLDELDTLLGIKRSSQFDSEDIKHLTEGQSKELIILKKLD